MKIIQCTVLNVQVERTYELIVEVEGDIYTQCTCGKTFLIVFPPLNWEEEKIIYFQPKRRNTQSRGEKIHTAHGQKKIYQLYRLNKIYNHSTV